MKRSRLENLVKIQSGYQARSKVIEVPFGTHRLLQARDIQDGQFNFQGTLRFNPDLDPVRYQIHQNDILFIARGYENRAYYIKNPPENVLASNTFYILRMTSEIIDPEFLGWWLNQAEAQSYFAQFQVQQGYVYLSKTNLCDLLVPIPPKETQLKIAAVQSLWEKERTVTEQIHTRKKKIIKKLCLSAVNDKEG